MNEDDLRLLLREAEPARQEVDQLQIVDSLCEQATRSSAEEIRPYGDRARFLSVGIACAACLAGMAFMVNPKSGKSPPVLVRNAPVREAPPTQSQVPDARTGSGEASEPASSMELLAVESDRLELEIQSMLSNSRKQKSRSPSTQLLLDESPGSISRSEIRASEGLWLLLSDFQDKQLVSAESIIQLYPNSPAARRCEQLAAK